MRVGKLKEWVIEREERVCNGVGIRKQMSSRGDSTVHNFCITSTDMAPTVGRSSTLPLAAAV